MNPIRPHVSMVVDKVRCSRYHPESMLSTHESVSWILSYCISARFHESFQQYLTQ